MLSGRGRALTGCGSAPLGIDDLRPAVADLQGERGKVIESQRAKTGRGGG